MWYIFPGVVVVLVILVLLYYVGAFSKKARQQILDVCELPDSEWDYRLNHVQEREEALHRRTEIQIFCNGSEGTRINHPRIPTEYLNRKERFLLETKVSMIEHHLDVIDKQNEDRRAKESFTELGKLLKKC